MSQQATRVDECYRWVVNFMELIIDEESMEITSDGKLPLMRIMELAYDVNCQVTI
ncbi:hypothetical protein Hanom_Chr04g00284831 [Helianthus anomalus]